MRRRLIAGNWKMHKTVMEAEELVAGIIAAGEPDDQVVICPPFTDLLRVRELLFGTGFTLGAQNMHWAEVGAYTGEISPRMLAELACSFVILGHSERRQIFRETDDEINKKVIAALGAVGLSPILCLGETRDVREAGHAQAVVGGQLLAALNGVKSDEAPRLVLAYEPIWAIGSGQAAGPADAQEMAAFLRGELAQLFGDEAAQAVRILYGGSVTPANSESFLSQPDVDGALIGGASLEADKFTQMYRHK